MKRLSTLALFLLCWNVGADAQYSLTVESTPATTMAGQTVYRFYVDMQDPGDELLSVYGNSQSNLIVNAPDGIYNSGFNASWSAEGINPAFLPVFPELADDTYATIGLDGPASSSGLGPQRKTQDLWRTPQSQSNRSFLMTVLQPCQAQAALDLHGMSPLVLRTGDPKMETSEF